MTEKFDVDAHIELWKKTVDVQQHFNDIELRIRALALTALTFVLGGTAFVYINTAPIIEGDWWHLNVATFIPVVGLVLWYAFWMVDSRWYHILLLGSVKDGERLEALLQSHGVQARLGMQIREESGSARVWPFREKKRSSQRLTLFYRVVAGLLGAVTAGILLLGFAPVPLKTPEVVVNNRGIVRTSSSPTPAPPAGSSLPSPTLPSTPSSSHQPSTP